MFILSENTPSNLRMVYELVDDTFADIFFFRVSEVKALSEADSVGANDLAGGILLSWIRSAHVVFDQTGLIELIQSQTDIKIEVGKDDTWNALQKTSYNFAQNKRYFESQKTLYHKALEIRLMYSVVECLTTLFSLKNEPWRGEKYAVQYMTKHHPTFYTAFCAYHQADTLEKRMRAYTQLVAYIGKDYELFSYQEPVCITRDIAPGGAEERSLWEKIAGKET